MSLVDNPDKTGVNISDHVIKFKKYIETTKMILPLSLKNKVSCDFIKFVLYKFIYFYKKLMIYLFL